MNLRTSAGWRRLGLIVLIVLAPIVLGVLGFALVDVQGFMSSPWAFWLLMASLFIPYSIVYTADTLRRREARTAVTPSGDSSPLVFASSADPKPEKVSVDSGRSSGSSAAWIWVGLVLVVAYAVVRVALALANDGDFDWTVVVALFAVVCIATIMPSVIAWQRFRRSALRIDDSIAWPTLRTDQFASQLHRSRPGAVIPQDLILSATESAVNVWTTEREPRLLLSLPRDTATTVRPVTTADRLGSTGVVLERHVDGQVEAFELIVRRRGVFTYFRTDHATAERCSDDIAIDVN
ncbi:hypothetical protein ACFQ9V_10435 [Leifsonia sp. NPDC056665]|uniref:hypothetical protein n=1 Tax=Leifsonia sp. NPDC056665 TaxID=3345901 RepID=UPI003675AB1E